MNEQSSTVIEVDDQVFAAPRDGTDGRSDRVDATGEPLGRMTAGGQHRPVPDYRFQTPTYGLDLGKLRHGARVATRCAPEPHGERLAADEDLVKPRALALMVVVLAAPMGLFRRREKDEWLGELAEIRNDALTDVEPPEVHHELSADLTDGAPDDQLDAEVASEVVVVDELPSADDDLIDEQPPDESSDSPTVDGDGARLGEPQVASGPAPQPSPHRQHPGELWHAALDLAGGPPEEIGPEESLDPEEALETVVPAVPFGRARPFVGTGGDGSSGRPPAEGLDLGGWEAPGDGPGHQIDGPPSPEVVAAEEVGGDLVATIDGQVPRPQGPPRIHPPEDLFDRVTTQVSPEAEPRPTSPGTSISPGLASSGTGALTDGPVGRRTHPIDRRRSLFGGSESAPSVGQDRAAVDEPLRRLELNDDGEALGISGVVRLAPDCDTEVTSLGGVVGLSLDRGWCWVATGPGDSPVRIEVAAASLHMPSGVHALTVTEADGSVFVSVVRGSVGLERTEGTTSLPVGTITHINPYGTVTTERATATEMATDELLTTNLHKDVTREGR